MSDIKTYTHVNRDDANALFGISRMEDIYDKRNGEPDEPHRHDFFTVLLTKSAKGIHNIDFNEYELSNSQVFFVSPWQMHQVIEHQRSEGFSMVFSEDFLAANNIPLSFIDDVNLFRDFGETPPIELSTKSLEILTVYCNQIIEFRDSEATHKNRAIAALLELFLIQCNNICSKPENTQQLEAGNTILRQFKQLVDKHHRTEHSTAFYASELHITPDHLNRTVKSLIGKTAKQFIQSRVTIAAKRMLVFSELSHKEIGFELGFSEPANFSAFFKKCTGKSPSEFQSQIQA